MEESFKEKVDVDGCQWRSSRCVELIHSKLWRERTKGWWRLALAEKHGKLDRFLRIQVGQTSWNLLGPGGQWNVADGSPDKVNWLVSWMLVAVGRVLILNGLQSWPGTPPEPSRWTQVPMKSLFTVHSMKAKWCLKRRLSSGRTWQSCVRTLPRQMLPGP